MVTGLGKWATLGTTGGGTGHPPDGRRRDLSRKSDEGMKWLKRAAATPMPPSGGSRAPITSGGGARRANSRLRVEGEVVTQGEVCGGVKGEIGGSGLDRDVDREIRGEP